jgi:hypothetical protein
MCEPLHTAAENPPLGAGAAGSLHGDTRSKVRREIKGLAIGGRDGSFLIIDHVGHLDVVVGVRSHTGEALRVYLMDTDIEKLMEFLCRKHD